MSEVWLNQNGRIDIHIPEIEELANAMNRIADELAKANSSNKGKHIKLESEEMKN